MKWVLITAVVIVIPLAYAALFFLGPGSTDVFAAEDQIVETASSSSAAAQGNSGCSNRFR